MSDLKDVSKPQDVLTDIPALTQQWTYNDYARMFIHCEKIITCSGNPSGHHEASIINSNHCRFCSLLIPLGEKSK